MTLDIVKYDERPRRIEAVEITLDNLDEICTWIRADSITRTRTIDDVIFITFNSYKLPKSESKIVFGDGSPVMYMVKNPTGGFATVTKSEIDNFWEKAE